MESARLAALKNLVAQNPSDSFSRFGLAMEYRNTGDLESAAREFQALLEANPGYAAAYFHFGQTLEKLARTDEAREVYRRGVEVTAAKGDRHAQSELEGALELM
ncbi:MAG: tetratricopeptide repeat protein [Acidobacteriia bacterium]|nr:tetratricopeptide repeat protein [Terriglobia bacterium]